jgi:hypothetical protein
MSRRKRAAREKGSSVSANDRRLALPSIRTALVALIILVLAGIGAGIYLVAARDGGRSTAGGKSAAIVDQLSLTQPSPEFVSSARDLLTDAGYAVDYFPGDKVTVDLYRTLPERDYDVILLRVHAGITTEVNSSSGQSTDTEYVSLFTGEPYVEGKYGDEELNRIGKATYYEGAAPLFGIGPDFVTYSMEGKFDDTLIVMMGCDGLRSQKTGQTFLDKGASAFVSWTLPVSATHTDAATERFLELLLDKNLAARQAVALTNRQLGADPTYGAELRILEATN